MTNRMKEFKARMKANSKSVEYQFDADMGVPMRNRDLKACEKFLREVQRILNGRYEIVGSCNKDISKYLIPIGTEKQITYYGKPELSFRISDHWNWYSNLRKCSNRSYVQCESADMPAAREREDERATNPRRGLQVAIQGTDGKYHHVFGYKWNPETKEFCWVQNDPMDICRKWGLA